MVCELKLKLQAHVLTVSFSYNFLSFSIDCWSFLGAVHTPVGLIKLISSIISHSDFSIFIYLLPLIYNFKTFDCFPALIGMNKILERNHRSCYSSQNNVAENETQITMCIQAQLMKILLIANDKCYEHGKGITNFKSAFQAVLLL